MSPTVPPISEMTTSRAARLGDRADARLDLVRDVRDHLHRRAEEVALALLAQHGVPDRARAVARVAREVLVDEALVVADVEVGLGAVLGDEDLAVLERAHRARVDVQVRIELLELDAQAARLQQPAERRSDDAFAERRDDAPRDEDVLRGPVRSRDSKVAAPEVGGAHAVSPVRRSRRAAGRGARLGNERLRPISHGPSTTSDGLGPIPLEGPDASGRPTIRSPVSSNAIRSSGTTSTISSVPVGLRRA